MARIHKIWTSVCVTLGSLFVFMPEAFAQAAAADNDNTTKAMVALATGFGLAIAAAGGAMGQGKAAAAALEGMARNPSAGGRLFTTVILAMALIESLVIYSLVISFMLLGKI